MLCAPSSIQWYMDQNARTSGLGGTSRSLFVFLFFCMFPCFPPTSTGHSFRDIWMQFCRHITIGGIQSPSKNFGGRTPLGGKFSQNFCWDIDLKINLRESCSWSRKKYAKKIFDTGPPGLGGVASKVLELRFSNLSTRLQATVLEILRWNFLGTLP